MKKESVLKKKPYRLWVENAFCENWLKSPYLPERQMTHSSCEWLNLGKALREKKKKKTITFKAN